MRKKISILLFLMLVLISMSAVSALDLDDNNDTITTSSDAEALTLEHDFNTIDDLNKDVADSDDKALENDTESVAVVNKGNGLLSADNDENGNILKVGEGNLIDLENDISRGLPSGYAILEKDIYKYDGRGGTIIINIPGTIDGNGAIIDMEGSNMRAFNVTASGVTIKNLTIKNAYFDGGSGGAIYFNSDASLGTVENCNFTDNAASNNGGAVFFSNKGILTNCNFDNNEASYGSAVAFSYGNVANCSFTNNKATDGEGAVCIHNDGDVTNCSFINNTSPTSGGAIYNYDGSINITNSIFINNHDNEGYAIFSQGHTLAADYNWWGQNATDYQKNPYSAGLINQDINNWYFLNMTLNKNTATISLNNLYAKTGTISKDENCKLPGQNFTLTAVNAIFSKSSIIISDTADVDYEVTDHPAKLTARFETASITQEAPLGDFELLQKLIDNASDNGIINLERNYTYITGLETITDGIIINKNLTINGNGFTIDAKEQSRIFYITSSQGATLNNITFANGRHSTGGAIYFAESGTVTDCNFTDNAASNNGGAVFFSNEGILTNCNFDNNEAPIGSAVAFSYGNVANCSFTNNQATDGEGAVCILNDGDITNCSFINNTSPASGGAIYNYDGSINITNSIFINNHDNEGYAIFSEGHTLAADYNWWGQNATDYQNNPHTAGLINQDINNWYFLNMTANENTATISLNNLYAKTGTISKDENCKLPGQNFTLTAVNAILSKSSIIISDTADVDYEITDNPAKLTARFETASYTISLKNKIHKWYVNASAGQGGNGSEATPFQTLKEALDEADNGDAIMIASGEYTGTYNTRLDINKNLNFIKYGDGEVIFDAESQGRIWKVMGMSVNITGLTFKNGKSDANGGAIYCLYPTNVINCNFTENTADIGGAIYFDKEGNVSDCTFTGNTATRWGGAIRFDNAYDKNYTVNNCAFVNNSAQYGKAISSSGELKSADNNWWGSNNPDWNELINRIGQKIPSSYAVLDVTTDKQTIAPGSKAKLNYAFYRNETTEILSIPERAITLSATDGNLNDTSGYLVNGEFSTEFSADAIGDYEISAMVDNQEVKITVTVALPILYVNATAASSGDGRTKETPFKTLKEALDVAYDDYTIMIAAGTYTGTDNTGLSINNNVSFEKYGDGEAIFDAENQWRIWHVNAASINITGLTFKNGNSTSYGGAIYLYNKVTNSNINATFINNKADNGGAIYINNGFVTGNVDGTYINNTASYNGGAIRFRDNLYHSNVGGTYINNTAGNNGGAIYFNDISSTDMTGRFINNTGKNVIFISGAYAIGEELNNVIHDSIFINNNVSECIINGPNSIQVNFNWFGNNATNYASKPNINGPEVKYWLFLNATAEPGEVRLNENSKITFKWYSYGYGSTSEYNDSKINIDLALSQTLGKLNQTTSSIGEEVLYTAKQNGNGTVTGKFETASYTIELNNVKLPTQINITNETVDLKVNGEVSTGATLTPADAGNLTYTSSNSTVAIVENGKIKALANGTATITVSFAGNNEYAPSENKTIVVTVTLNDASVTVNNDTLDLVIGDEFTLASETSPAGLDVNYTSTNTSIVTVDADGNVKAVGNGTATIVVSVGDDKVYAINTTSVAVTVKIPTEINVTKPSVELYVGGTGDINWANLIPPEAGSLKYSSNDTSVIWVSSSEFSADGAGTALITVSFAGNDNYAAAENKTITVTVKKWPTEITLENETMALKVNDETPAGAALEPSLAGELSYTSSDESVVKVKNGNITAVGEGTATVTVSFNGTDYYAAAENKTINVTVSLNDARVDAEDMELTVGENNTVKYYTTPAGLNVTYVPDNSGVVSVDENGTVTALKGGTATIIVKIDGEGVYFENSTALTVTVNKIPTEITIANATLNLNALNFTTVGANLTPSEAGNLTYNSTNSSVAMVFYGIIISVGQGNATITVSFAGNDQYAAADNKTIEVIVSLNDASVSVDNSTLDLKVGDNYTINATTVPSIVKLFNITYTSSDESVATVDENGTVTAIGEGNAIITVGVGDDRVFAKNSTTVTVTVSKIPTEIIVQNSTIEMFVGDEVDPVVSLMPSDAGELDFTSSDVSVVTVNAIGEITAVGDGVANVTVRFMGNDKYSAAESKNITVTVSKIPTEINIAADTLDLLVRDEFATGAELIPAEAGNLTYTSSDEKVVKVANNKIIAVGEGNATITASFDGNNKYLPAESKTISVKVTKKESSIDIEPESVEVVAGEDAAITVILPEDATGIVLVDVGDNKYYGEVENGNATVNLAGLPAGNYTAKVIYPGDDKYTNATGSVSIKVDEIPEPVDPKVNITVPDVKAGETAKAVVELPSDATGNVIVRVDGKEAAGLIVYGGTVEIPLGELTAGNHTVVAVYSGNSKYGVGVASKDITVEKLTTNVSAEPVETVEGETATITVTVDENATGTILIDINGNKYYADITAGKATVNVVGLTAGDYTATVTYTGDDNYGEANTTATVKVDAKPAPKSESSIAIAEVNDHNITGILSDANGKAIADAEIKYTVNGTAKTLVTAKDGSFVIEALPNAPVSIEYAGDDKTEPAKTSITIKENESPVPVKVDSYFNITGGVITLNGYAVDTKAGEEGIYYATELLDANGNPIKGAKIRFAVNDKIYNRTTKENGSFTPYKLNMIRAGRYTMAFYFEGNDNYTGAFASVCVDLDKKPIKIKASNKSYKKSVKTKKYTVTLSTKVCSSHDGKAHLRSGLKVSLTVNGKTYNGKTNSKGQVTFKITNLSKKAKFKAKISYKGDQTYESASKTVTITVK